MPLSNVKSLHNINKSTNDTIDFDFYDSDFNKSDCNEINPGVRKIDIKPLQRNPGKIHDLTFEKNVGSKFGDDLVYSENELTKCIAFERNNSASPDSTSSSIVSVSTASKSSSEEDNSPVLESLNVSSPSSDLTTVTPMPFSCSSSNSSIKNFDKDEDSQSVEEICEKSDMKLLADAVETLSLQHKNMRSQIKTFPCNTNRSQCNRTRRKNMTFTNEQLRKINRENEILLKKIMSYSKPNTKPSVMNNTSPPTCVKASAAINRKKNQRQINHDNYILLKKIHSVKPTPSISNSRNHL
ncbi:uncharacterized protein LOC142332059 [Lycorma delicatula]|uniref:uncharacterized protein LOC142332059 n=1 Tax=Lycorma delicatula TaxID=130591 RepID=UPI003F518651